MKALLENRWLLLALRVFFGGMFVYASLDKIANPAQFANAVDNYHFLPHSLVNLMAIGLPWLELIIGLALIAGIWTGGAALISAGLCLMFLIAVTQAYARGLDISCGCFSQSGEEKIGLGLIVRDVLLTVGSVWILAFHGGRDSVLSVFARNR